MALSRFQAQIKWAAADFKTINTNSAVATSDAYVFDSSDVSAMVTLSLSTDGTQASGDYGDFYILWYTGSAVKGADGTGTNKENGALYTKDDVEHAQFLCRLDNRCGNLGGTTNDKHVIFGYDPNQLLFVQPRFHLDIEARLFEYLEPHLFQFIADKNFGHRFLRVVLNIDDLNHEAYFF